MEFKMSTKCGFEPTLSAPTELTWKLEAEVMVGCDEIAGALPMPDVRRNVSIGRMPSLSTLKLRLAARVVAAPPEVPAEVRAEVQAQVAPEVALEVVLEVVPEVVLEVVPEAVPEVAPEVAREVEREVVHQVTEEPMQHERTIEGNDYNENVDEHEFGGLTVKQEHPEVRTQVYRTTGMVFQSVILAGAVSLGLRRRHRSKAASTPPVRFISNLKEFQGTCNPPPTHDENIEPCIIKTAQNEVKQDWHDKFKGFVPRPPTVPRERHQFKRQTQLMGSTISSPQCEQVSIVTKL